MIFGPSERNQRLSHHAALEERLLPYLRERINPYPEGSESSCAYVQGQLDLIRELRRCALEESFDA